MPVVGWPPPLASDALGLALGMGDLWRPSPAGVVRVRLPWFGEMSGKYPVETARLVLGAIRLR